jgi:hypothetical protein
MLIRPEKDEKRTLEQLREHYQVEKELARKLARASKQQRAGLYSSLYDELFKRLPHHPQLTRKASTEYKGRALALQMPFLRRFLNKETTFLEIGPGDCALSFEVAKVVKKVYGVDVSTEITRHPETPQNFEFIHFDGCRIPLPPNSVNVAYSNQLMEHLHPEDAFEQLQSIYETLQLGGAYICITPNRVTGPHDISRFFDKVATGFHLKEYRTSEMQSLFQRAGFSRIKGYIGTKRLYISLPFFIVRLCECLLTILPYPLRKTIARNLFFRVLLGVRFVGEK